MPYFTFEYRMHKFLLLVKTIFIVNFNFDTCSTELIFSEDSLIADVENFVINFAKKVKEDDRRTICDVDVAIFRQFTLQFHALKNNGNNLCFIKESVDD